MSKEEKTVLQIGDRIQLANVLPAKDSFERLLIREGILAKTKLKTEEIANHKLQTTAEGIVWEKDDLKYKYEFDQNEKDYIRGCLKDLSDKKQLGADALGLYKMFVNG